MDNDFGSGNTGDDGVDQTGVIDDMLGNINGPSDTHKGIEDDEDGNTSYGVDASRSYYSHSGANGVETAIEHESTVRGSDGHTGYSHKEHREDSDGN